MSNYKSNYYCIYCKKEFKKNSEHARSAEHIIPRGLMQPGSDGLTLKNRICAKCNQGVLSEQNQLFLMQSIPGFIHSEFEASAGRYKSSIHHTTVYGIPPLRAFGVGGYGDIRMVELGESTLFEGEKLPEAKPLPSQIILTIYDQSTSYEEVLNQNIQNVRNGKDFPIPISTEIDIYRIGLNSHSNIHIFGPIAAKQFYENIDEFIIQKFLPLEEGGIFAINLTWIPPEKNSEFSIDAQSLFNKVRHFLGYDKQVEIGKVKHSEEVSAYRVMIQGKTDCRRAIAQIVFHYFLKKTEKIYTGHEEIFNEIKEFIYSGNCSRNLVYPGGMINNIPLPRDMVTDCEHRFVIYRDNNDIIGIIQFFMGTKNPLRFDVILTGYYKPKTLFLSSLETIPYNIDPNHQLRNKIDLPTDEWIDLAKRGWLS